MLKKTRLHPEPDDSVTAIDDRTCDYANKKVRRGIEEILSSDSNQERIRRILPIACQVLGTVIDVDMFQQSRTYCIKENQHDIGVVIGHVLSMITFIYHKLVTGR